MAKGFIKCEIDGVECKLEMRGKWGKVELIAAAARIVAAVAEALDEKGYKIAKDILWAIEMCEKENAEPYSEDLEKEADKIINRIFRKK